MKYQKAEYENTVKTLMQSARDEKEAMLFTALIEITDSARTTLLKKCAEVLANVTDQEREQITQGQYPFRLAKALLIACSDEIDRQYNAESLIPDVRRIKRLRKSRYC